MPASLTNNTLSTTGETALTISGPVQFSSYGTVFKGMQCGTKSITGTGAQNYTGTITFSNAFATTPIVVVTGDYDNNTYAVTILIDNVNTSNFSYSVRFSNNFYNTGTIILNWIAINT